MLVFLNGPPSSGKSTIARALHDLLDEPYYYQSLDEYRRGYAERHWLADDGDLFRRTREAYLGNLRTLVSLGHHVIAEAMFLPDIIADYLRLFAGFPVLLVGVACPLEEAQRRERLRGDRGGGPINLAVPEFDLVHAHRQYDLEIESSTTSPAAAARRIKELIHSPPSPTAFEVLRGRVLGEGE